jgi:hypothetical protein
LTLLLEQIQGQTSQPFGNFTYTETRFERSVVILDARTLQGGGWAQPRIWESPGPPAMGNPFNFGGLREQPRQLATAHNGCFITLPPLFLALGKNYSLAARFAAGAVPFTLQSDLGSINGMIVSNSTGSTFNGGVSDGFQHPGGSHVTPCGRYRLVNLPSPDSSAAIEVRTVENNRALFRMARPDLDRNEFNGDNYEARRRSMVVADEGPLIILAGGGRRMQIVELNIPQLAQQFAPTEFHVTSQPTPCVMSGGSLDYQIAVNNTDAVSTFRLRNPVAGAALSPEGRLTYLAPQVAEPTRMQIPTEIEGKDGQTVIHNVTIFALPPLSPKPSPTPVPRQNPI